MFPSCNCTTVVKFDFCNTNNILNKHHAQLTGRTSCGCSLNKGLVMEAKGAYNLVDFLAAQGFAGVSEPLLRKLCQACDWKTSDSPLQQEEGHHLAVTAMLHQDPTLTEEEVIQRICHRSEVEKWTPEASDKDLEEVVRDTLLVGDQDKALKELSRRKSQVSATALRPKVAKLYASAIKNIPSDKWKKAEPMRQEKIKAQVSDSKKGQKDIERIYAKLNSTVDEKMRCLLPDNVHAWPDQFNGRWRLSYRGPHGQAARSISWTQIGSKRAAAECVRQGWSWVEQHEGHVMPDKVVTKLKSLSE